MSAEEPRTGTPDPTRPRIVVGVDGSDSSRAALRWVTSLAGLREGTEVEAVMTWEAPPSYGWATMGWAQGTATQTMQQACAQMLTTVVEEVYGVQRPAGLRLTVQEGNPAKVLLDLSADSAMLVVGSRGLGGFAGLLLGSVSARCAEHARCPVLVVHGDGP